MGRLSSKAYLDACHDAYQTKKANSANSDPINNSLICSRMNGSYCLSESLGGPAMMSCVSSTLAEVRSCNIEYVRNHPYMDQETVSLTMLFPDYHPSCPRNTMNLLFVSIQINPTSNASIMGDLSRLRTHSRIGQRHLCIQRNRVRSQWLYSAHPGDCSVRLCQSLGHAGR